MAETRTLSNITHYLEQFNVAAKTSGEDFEWSVDTTNPNVVDPGEIKLPEEALKKYGLKQEDWKAGSVFRISQELAAKIEAVKNKIEGERREAVQKELARTTVVTIPINLDDYYLTAPQQKLIQAILDAGRVMDELYQAQQGGLRFKEAVEKTGTPKDKAFYQRYQTVWCEDTKNTLCNAVQDLPFYATPLYPSHVDCKALKDKLKAPFSAVEKTKGKWKATPYAQVTDLKPLIEKAVVKLKEATRLAKEANEKELANYMKAVALALQSKKPYPYVQADEQWIAARTSRFFLRIGADEPMEDKTCQLKAQFHMSFGIKDPEAEKALEKMTAKKQDLEAYLASLIEGYKTRDVQVQTPEFVNVVMENGESRGSTTGTAAGQTLPNWCGEDGKAECKTRIMIYTNKTKLGYTQQLLDQMGQIFSQNIMDYLDVDVVAQTIVRHEFSHNFGPQMKNYQEKLGDMLLRLEELKAQIGGVALQPVLEKLGLTDPKKEKSLYASLIAWSFGHIRRAAPKGDKFYESKSPYVQLASVIVGTFTEKGVLSFQDGKWDIDYDKAPEAAKTLYADVGGLFIRGDRKEVENFFLKYTSGEGLKYLHLDRINETLAKVPATLFEYQIHGTGGV